MATIGENEQFVKEILCSYPLDVAVDFIKGHFNPQDIFDEKELKTWAENNGYEIPQGGE